MGDVCRLCSSGVELMNVSYPCAGKLRDMIKVASGVEILETDVISKKICILCCKIAAEVYKFRQRSSQNSQKLMEEYNERRQLELSKKTASKKQINIDGNNSKQLQISKSIDNKIKPPNEHPSIQQIKKQYPNLKFPLILPNANFQPYITLLTNEVSHWHQQRNSTTHALFKVNEERFKRPQSPNITPSSKNIQCSSSSEELDEIRVDGTEKQNTPEKAVTKNSSFCNIQDNEKNVRMETNQIDCQTNDKQDDPEQSQNKIDSIKPKRNISQPTEEENLEETPKRKSSKEKGQTDNVVNSEQTQNKIDSTIRQKRISEDTEEENLKETPKRKSSKEKVQIDNEVNSEQTQNKIESTARIKRISEHTEEENLEETPKRKSSKREVEIDNEINSEQTQHKTDSIRRKRSISPHTEVENLKEAPKRKSSKREVELDNQVLNKKHDTKFGENAKNNRQIDNKSQTEEKEVDTFNNNKKESSSVNEVGEIMETKTQTENKFPSKIKASKQDETQNKTSKLLHKNKEMENKSNNSGKEKEVCNQTGDKEKPKNEVESIKADKASKEPVIDFCLLREILRTKLRRNSTLDETNNLESNVIDNEVTNEKHDTKFDEKAKNVRPVDNNSQIEEKKADTSNNNKKESSSVKEISDLMETKKQKANKSSSKIKTSKQEETQNKTSKLLEKNKEIENKSTNLAKENEVCNQTGDKEKPINEVESRRAGKDSKEPVIDFCALREILRRNSTHDETNNLESNVINTSTPPGDTATSPSSNNLQKISFIRSLDLIPSSERGEYEKDSNHEMLRIRCVKFVCQYCQTHYNTLKSLRAHEKKYHTSCTFCNLHLDSIEDRKKHMLFHCPNRTIRIPKVILFKVDKQREMIAKYAKAFQFLNLNASSDTEKLTAQRTVTPMDLDPSESANNDGCAHSVHNCQQYKLNWNVNYYNDVINTVNLGEPNFSVNIYNMVKDRTFYSLDTIVENTISHEYYLKNLSLELCFQKVKIVLIYGKAMVYHYDKGKHLPTVTPKKDFWDNEAPIQPQVNIKNIRGEDSQRTVSQTHIDLNHKTYKNNVNLLDNAKGIMENINNQIPQETSTEAKGAQSVRNKTSLQNSNIKQNVVGHTNSVLSPQNASKVNKVLSPRRSETEMERTIPQNVVSLDNLDYKPIQNRVAIVEMERLNMEKRREFHKANVQKHVTCSSDTTATIQVVNIENGDPSQIVSVKNVASATADEKIHKESGIVFEMVNVENGTKHKMGTGEAPGKINMESSTVSQPTDIDNKIRRSADASVLIKRLNVETGTVHERISVEKATERNLVSKEAINEVDAVNRIAPKTANININTTPSVKTGVAIQNPNIDSQVSPQVSTVQKNKDQNMQDIELIRLLEAEIEEIGRKDLPTQMPNIRQEVTAQAQVQEKALLLPTNLPGTSRQVSGNRSQNLSSNYVIFPSMSTANASQPAIFNASVAQIPNIRRDVLANMHMLKKAPLQRSNLSVTSTQVSSNVGQRHLPTPLIYSVPSASSTNVNQCSTLNLTDTVPHTGNSYILAGQNLIFISPQQQRSTPVSQLQTSNNNRSVLRNRQANVSLSSSSFQIPSSSVVSLQMQQSPASSSTNATSTFVSKIRVKDVKELS